MMIKLSAMIKSSYINWHPYIM